MHVVRPEVCGFQRLRRPGRYLDRRYRVVNGGAIHDEEGLVGLVQQVLAKPLLRR